jgi:hypothetical protein
MKTIIIITVCLCTTYLNAQLSLEYQTHVNSMLEADSISPKMLGMSTNIEFKDYVIKNKLDNQSDSLFISNRFILKKLNLGKSFSKNYFQMSNDEDFFLSIKLDTVLNKVESLTFKVDSISMTIPDSLCVLMRTPNLLDKKIDSRPIEIYKSLSEEYFYVYIYGGQNANFWITKLIFSNEKYLGKISLNYFDMSINGCFRKGFLGI